ncbi:hypothetical protein C8F01DRAFT_1255725 [Mycena amicta]|nr:hypothetical protein C8F01DRAFT_1256344 [Mycena amicta]KAJ7058579.1 hypothetical protein C8F01DRAFT_1255725 [Mycena amicta]
MSTVRPRQPTVIYSDSDDNSDDNELPPQKPAAKARRGRPVTPHPEPVTGGRARKASAKQAEIEKENAAQLARENEKLRKRLARAQRAATGSTTNKAGDIEDDGPESEEGMTETEDPIGMTSRIRALQPLSQPTSKHGKVTKVPAGGPKKKKVKMTLLLSAPEPTPEEMLLDSQPSPPASPSRPLPENDDDEDHPPLPPSSLSRSSSPARDAAARRSKRSAASDVEGPPAKRHKDDARSPEFRDGHAPAGGKPKAADYEPTDAAIILRACQTYTVKVLTINPFPSPELQTEWVTQVWKEACRVGHQRIQLPHRIIKIIIARGSQARGNIITAYRSLCASTFKFERSSSQKVIDANKAKAEKLIKSAVFHYKDPDAEVGYAENKILHEARRLFVFRDNKSFGPRFPTAFNPLPLAVIALEFTALEFCLKEWATGSHVAAKFYEKDVSASYATHLADVEVWANLDQAVTSKLRQKWYRRAVSTLTSAVSTMTATNLSLERQEALRAQLASRTGDTDSEDDEDSSTEA